MLKFVLFLSSVLTANAVRLEVSNDFVHKVFTKITFWDEYIHNTIRNLYA